MDVYGAVGACSSQMELRARVAVSISAVPDCLFIAVFPLRPREQRERSRGVAIQAPIESGDCALRVFFFLRESSLGEPFWVSSLGATFTRLRDSRRQRKLRAR